MDLSRFTTSELQSEIARRGRELTRLETRREEIVAELKQLDAELGASPSFTPRPDGAGRRGRNALSLADAIAAALDVSAVVSPKEAAELVRANGYETHAKNFGMMVSNALAKDERFRRVARGQYERVS